jgi:hypothetical protein
VIDPTQEELDQEEADNGGQGYDWFENEVTR